MMPGVLLIHTQVVLFIALCALAPTGCETIPEATLTPPRHAIPALQGSYYQVRPGETLWGIARSYGVDPRALASANRITPETPLQRDQRLFIPLPAETNQFLWPVRGSVVMAGPSRGVRIRAAAGSLVRASRGGRVAVATRDLSGWGKTVIVDHLDGYLTIYAGLEQILISPGAQLRQGTPLGSLGSSPLHFEIRYGAEPKNTAALLPKG